MGVWSYHWVTFNSNSDALRALRALIDAGQVRPHIDSAFDLRDLVQAHERCEAGHSNGRIILRFVGPERRASSTAT
jgi:NADPH:quinone reductase-like Zn-dependent oxidoreductase